MRYFLGVGAQKAGTSWLHTQLATHPQVALPRPRKELHYFDSVTETKLGESWRTFFTTRLDRDLAAVRKLTTDPEFAGSEEERRSAIDQGAASAQATLDLIKLGNSTPAQYREFLSRTATPRTEIAGEITPEYAALTDEGWQLVKDTLDPLVIMCLRDPLERYWSAVRMFAENQPGYSQTDLNWMFKTRIRGQGMWARTDYATTLDALDRFFGADRTLILFYETMMTEETLGRVGEFLGVAPEWGFEVDKRTRVGRDSRMPPVPEVIKEKLAPVYAAMRERFGDDLPESWHTDI